MEQHETHLTQESILFQYSAALERGDFETVAAILEKAEHDPILAQMIFEVNDVYAKELEPPYSQAGRHSIVDRFRWGKFNPTKRSIVLVVGAVVLVLLFLPILPQNTHAFGMAGFSRTNVVSWLSQRALSGARYAALPTLAPPAQPTLFSGYVAEREGWRSPPTAAPPTPAPAPHELVTSSIIDVTPLSGGIPAPTTSPAATYPLQPTGQGGPIENGTPMPVQPQERMIVKNGEIDLLVKSAGTAIDQVTQIATDNGGYVLTSQTYLDGPARYATLTIAVRADQFETAMRRLRQSAIEVLRELSTGQDVSTEYVDLQSRLRNLEVTRDRIQAFLADAVNVQEALDINRQLADIEAQIEQVKGRMTYLSGRSAFSTITVNIQEKLDATPTPTSTPTLTPTPTPPWSLAPTLDEAAKTQVNLLRGLLEVFTWLVVVPGPYCLTAGLIAWAAWAFNRRRKPGP